MRVIICGSRNWNKVELIESVIRLIHKSDGIDLVIHGGCKGADKIAEQMAKTLGIPTKEYLADWKSYGKSAGQKRNQVMIDDGRPDLVLAFHNNIQESKGTKDMISRANKAGIPSMVIKENMMSQFQKP